MLKFEAAFYQREVLPEILLNKNFFHTSFTQVLVLLRTTTTTKKLMKMQASKLFLKYILVMLLVLVQGPLSNDG